jgi:hypothetical protein
MRPVRLTRERFIALANDREGLRGVQGGRVVKGERRKVINGSS